MSRIIFTGIYNDELLQESLQKALIERLVGWFGGGFFDLCSEFNFWVDILIIISLYYSSIPSP